MAFIATSWFLGTYLVLCFMGSQIHTYYTVALAPPLSLTVGIAVDIYVRHHRLVAVRAAASVAVLAGAVSSWLILASVVGWPDWLGGAVLVLGALGAALLGAQAPTRWLQGFAGVVAAAALLAGPIATSLHNVSLAHNGSNPVSGPLTKNHGSISRFLHEMQNGNPEWAYNLAFGQKPSEEIVGRLKASHGCTWAAATYASQTAARLQIEAGRPVTPVGGFAGTDPSPTLEQFIDRVEGGQICYFLADDAFLATQTEKTEVVEISEWVKANYESEVVDGRSVYDLNKPR
jgi:hypothetical protein